MFWNKLPTKQNKFPWFSDDINMWILREGSEHGRKFRNHERKNVMAIFSSFYNRAMDLLKLLPCPDLVCLGMWILSRSLYKAPGCHCGLCSHPFFFTCFSHCHLRLTSRWDSWGTGCSWEARGLCHQLTSTQKPPLGLAQYIKPGIPPVPSAPHSSWSAAPMAVHTWAEVVLLQQPISKGDRGQILDLPLHVHGFQQCCVKSNCPLLPDFSVKLPLSSYYTEIIPLVCFLPWALAAGCVAHARSLVVQNNLLSVCSPRHQISFTETVWVHKARARAELASLLLWTSGTCIPHPSQLGVLAFCLWS